MEAVSYRTVNFRAVLAGLLGASLTGLIGYLLSPLFVPTPTLPSSAVSIFMFWASFTLLQIAVRGAMGAFQIDLKRDGLSVNGHDPLPWTRLREIKFHADKRWLMDRSTVSLRFETTAQIRAIDHVVGFFIPRYNDHKSDLIVGSGPATAIDHAEAITLVTQFADAAKAQYSKTGFNE